MWPRPAILQFGDTVRVEMKGKDGQSLFGAGPTWLRSRGMAATAEGRPAGHGRVARVNDQIGI